MAEVPARILRDSVGRIVKVLVPESVSGSGSISATDYAVGDGVTDETVALNQALAAAAGKKLVFPRGGTFKVTGTLNIPSGTVVEGNGATLDATGMAVASSGNPKLVLACRGTFGPVQTISTALDVEGRVISGIASTSGIAANDLILVNNEESPVPGMVRTDRDKGELLVVQSVDSGTQLTVSSGATFSYSATNLRLRKVNAVEDVVVRDLKIKCGGVGSGHDGLEFLCGRNITVQNVKIDGAEDIAVNLRTVFNGRVIGCDLRNSTNPSYTTTGYLVCVVEGSRDILIDDNELYHSRHWVTGGGQYPATHVTVSNNRGSKSLAAAFDTHESCFFWDFRGNTGRGVSGGFGMRGQYVTVEANQIWDATGNAYEAKTFDLVTEQRSIRFLNNLAVRCAAAVVVDGNAHSPDPECVKIDCEVIGNTAIDCGGPSTDAFLLRVFDGMTVSDNNIIRAGRNGMLILGTVGTTSRELILAGNKITDPGQHGFEVQLVDDVVYGGGLIASPGQNGYQFTNCNRTAGSSPKVTNPGRNGVFITGGAGHSIASPQVAGGVNASYDAVRFSGTADVSVVGGFLSSARHAVNSTTTDYVVVTGVNVHNAANATKVNADASAVNKVIANNL